MKLKQLLERLKIKTHACFISFCEKEILFNPISDKNFLERIGKLSKQGFKLVPREWVCENSYHVTTKLSIKSILKKIKQICS